MHSASHGVIGTVATVFLVRPDGSVLLQHRDDKPGLRRANQWVSPGGHLESGEVPEVCARREFLEETGYRCAALHYVGLRKDLFEDGLLLLHVFWEQYDGVQPLSCFEGQEVRFVSRHDSVALDIPAVILSCWDEVLSLARGSWG